MGGEYWEFKTITERATNLRAAAYRQVRAAKKKSKIDVIVVHIERETTHEEADLVIHGVIDAIVRDSEKRIRHVIVVDANGEIVFQYRRDG